VSKSFVGVMLLLLLLLLFLMCPKSIINHIYAALDINTQIHPKIYNKQYLVNSNNLLMFFKSNFIKWIQNIYLIVPRIGLLNN